mgnify:CR=1 FL=1
MDPKTQKPRNGPSGFSLIITISMMVLLSLLAIGLLSLSTVSLRASRSGEAMATARANARMALMLAIGQLQQHAGRDQAVTATGAILGDSVAEPYWTGVWPSSGAKDQDFGPAWLVSGGAEADPAAGPTSGYPLVHSEDEARRVRVPASEIADTGGRGMSGRMAWWVADEGTKARVDLAGPERTNLGSTERTVRALSLARTNLGVVDKRFDPLQEEDYDRGSILSMHTAALATGDRSIPDEFVHDLTTAVEGLPVNVRDGGMKVDLSQAFANGEEAARQFDHYFGARPSPKSVDGAQLYEFVANDPRKFYFVDEISRNGSIPTGPNWGVLYNYHQLWTSIPSRGAAALPVIPSVPPAESDIRTNDWAPYNNAGSSQWERDRQHVNSHVSPVVSLLQMGFRLKTEPVKQGRSTKYKVLLEFKPVVGIWNPYNIPLRAEPYRFDWALYPYLRFALTRPGARWAYKAPRVWMREHWLSEGGDPENPANSWFQLKTEAVDLQPGEFRLFSISEQAKIRGVNTLYPDWQENGAIAFDVVDSNGEEILAEPDDLVHVGDLFLEDSQHPETAQKFGDFGGSSSASWFTLKAGNKIINRFSDLWLPGTDENSRMVIPEQVVSGWDGQTTTKPRFTAASLARAHHHVATWAFHLRTPTQAEQGQELRGFVDCNPRAVAANPTWDGSREGARRVEGWSFVSPMLGGSHPPGPRGDIGDGGPPGRGLIAEGGLGDQTPQTPGGPRFQGYGGPVNTAAGGQTHAIIFDIPRTPLVSLGQLQHAPLSRYNFEPSFVVGNSYANPRLSLDATFRDNFGNVPNFRLPDTSYLVNEELWDGYFFSTLHTDYLRRRGSLDATFGFKELASGERSLPNPRIVFRPLPGDRSIDRILSDGTDRAAEAIAARLRIDGAFNVNSTSVAAWKSILASLEDFEFPVLNVETGAVSWEDGSPIRFSRFGHVLQRDGYRTGDDGWDPAFWQGYRELSPSELDELAEAIVDEVRDRGPFRSMAEFVNRDPSSGQPEHARKGALQAALDRTLNRDLPETIGLPTTPKTGTFLNDVSDGESQAAGHAAYLLQGDLLQTLAPVLQPRSDTFLVRTMGESRDASGKLLATAYCEARVQRDIRYIDAAEKADTPAAGLERPVNQRFGRRFEVVSFRWLSPEEV